MLLYQNYPIQVVIWPTPCPRFAWLAGQFYAVNAASSQKITREHAFLFWREFRLGPKPRKLTTIPFQDW